MLAFATSGKSIKIIKKLTADWALLSCYFLFLVIAEVPQPIDYISVGRYLDCYECHSNRPGCGRELDWILQRWKRCDMPSPKCVKIIEKIGCMFLFELLF